jgi:hypothetical protein
MTDFTTIEELATGIQSKLHTNQPKKKVLAMYAFNATWKTRLSNLLSVKTENWEETDEWETWSEKIKTLCYNAFVEDMFVWDNENFVLKFNPNSWIMKLVIEQGLEIEIINNFKDIVNNQDIKLEPSFDFTSWEVSFQIASGDDTSTTNIKISKGEESVFIWCVFYTLVESAITELIIKKENRSTDIFDDLETIIIDDPVSSIDDTRIIMVAVKLVELIKSDHIDKHLQTTKYALEQQEFWPEYIKDRLIELRSENYEELSLKFLLTTHHALYYNVLVNSFRQEKRSWNFNSFSLSRDNNIYKLVEQWDSPFSYHLAVKELIQKAIHDDTIEKYHFNLLRALLEKTANFLGYENRYDCIIWDNKQESTRLLNLYSHSKLSDLEANELSDRDKILFQEAFELFIDTFSWKK